MKISPKDLLQFYAHGLFPMAESADSTELMWFDPDMRGILPLDEFKLSRSLRKTVLKTDLEIRISSDFEQTIRKCTEPTPDRPDTWINDEIVSLYSCLAEYGAAQSVECWRDDKMVGGLYGVCFAGAFFGESMFSREANASKIALVHLVARLSQNGFILLDTQFNNDHLDQFGCREIPRALYQDKLEQALQKKCTFTKGASEELLQQWLSTYQKPK